MKTGDEILPKIGPDMRVGPMREIEISAHGSESVVVADRALLYQGDYHKVGLDLVITDGETRLTIHDYFRAGRKPDLVTPDGTSLSGAVVESLATVEGGVRYAQAGAPAAGAVIGRVDTVTGSATAIRNGVSVTLNAGDPVLRGDSVQTAGGSSLGIVFIDGTTFSLSANARMVLNEMVYQAGGTGNTALLSIVQGSISFLAGQVAKTGDMRVDTPVATMGIRGTVVKTVSAENGATYFSVLREPDGTVGAVVLYSRVTGLEIARISQAGVSYYMASQTALPTIETKPPAEIAADVALAQRVFDLAQSAQQRPVSPDQPAQPQTPGTGPAGAPGGGVGSSSGGGGASTFDLPIGQGTGGGGAPSPLNPADIPVPPPAPINLNPPVVTQPPTASGGGGGGGAALRATSVRLEPDGPEIGVGASETFVVGEFGVLLVRPDGTTTYLPVVPANLPAGETATESFTLTLDGNGPSRTETLSFEVTGENDLATLTADVATVAQDGSVETSSRDQGLLANDIDPDRGETETLTIVAVRTASGDEIPLQARSLTLNGLYGTLTIFADGTYSYIADRADALAAGETVVETLFYVVADRSGGRVTGRLDVDVTGVNDAPVIDLDGDLATTGNGVTVRYDGAPIRFMSNVDISDPDRGALVSDVRARLQGGSERDGASISVDPVALAALGIRMDLESETLVFRAAAGGRLEAERFEDALALLTFSVDRSEVTNPTDYTIIVTVSDGVTNSTSLATVRVEPEPPNAAPDTASGSFVGQKDAAEPIQVALSGTDTDGSISSFKVTGVQNGTLYLDRAMTQVVGADGLVAAQAGGTSVYFDPNGGFGGVTGFGYAAIDDEGSIDATPATVTLRVNTAPTAVDDAVTGDNRAAFIVDVLANDSDPDAGDVLAVSSFTQAQHGTLTLNEDGTFSYRSVTGYVGADSFTYTTTDGYGGFATATVTLDVYSGAPAVTRAAFAVSEGGVQILDADDFTVADPDDADHVFFLSDVVRGRFQLAADSGSFVDVASFTTAELAAGRVRFVHDGEEGAPSFTVAASDGQAMSPAVAGAVTFTPVNDAPVVTAAGFAVSEGGSHVLTADEIEVFDPDDATHSYTVSSIGGVFQVANDCGTFTTATTFTDAELAAGRVRFLHDDGEAAPSFSVGASDGTLSSAVVAGVVSYTPVDDPSVISGDTSGAVREEGVAPGAATATGQLTAIDPDGPDDSFQAINGADSDSRHGAFSITADGAWTYTLNDADPAVDALRSGDSLADSFTVFTADGAAQTIAITITGANDAPTVQSPVTGSRSEGFGTGSIDLVSGSDDRDAGDVLSVEDLDWDEAASAGTLPAGFVLGSDGRTLTFNTDDLAYDALRAGELLTANFTYAVVDSQGARAATPGRAAVTIVGVNDAPTAVTLGNRTVSENAPGQVVGAVAVADRDSGDTFTYEVSDNRFEVAGGQLKLKAGIAVDHEAEPSISLQVTARDFAGASTSASFTITVTDANDAPRVSGPVMGSANEGSGQLQVALLAGASDADLGDTLRVENFDWANSATAGALPAGFSLSSDGRTLLVNTSSPAYDNLRAGGSPAIADFTYDVVDAAGARTAQTAQVRIVGTNDAPVISGPSAGAVREDQIFSTAGQLATTDPDAAAAPAWRIVGGTEPQPTDYRFGIDTLRITRTATGAAGAPLLFEDRFDGTDPTVAPAFGSNLTYSTDLAEVGGRGILDDETGASDVGVGTPDIFDSVSSRLRTNRSSDPANTAGLKKGADFTVSATYDLATALAYREAYGVRLTDRSVGNTDPSLDNIGDDVVEFVVRRGSDGILRVELRALDFRANTVTLLQAVELVPAAAADQIALRFMHVAGAGSVTAAFDLLSGGAVERTITFTTQGSLFGSDTGATTDDELFTTAQLIAFAPATADASIQGTYGTLILNQAGRWDYTLRNGDPAVQALGPNDTRADVFTVRATDDQGASDDQVITVTVTGTNDAPVITSTAFPLNEGGARVLSAGDIDVFDPDNTVHSYTVSGVAHGAFEVRNDCGSFQQATTFTDAQIAAGRVRFVHDGSEDAPTFTIRANDGLATGPAFAGTAAYMPTNDAPVLDLNGTDSMSGGQNYETTLATDTPLVDPATGIFGVTITDIDSPALASATAAIANAGSGDFLFVSDGAALAALGLTSSGGGSAILTLSGAASLANYADALKLIRFGNAGQPAAGDRLIDFVVNDGALDSLARRTTLHVPPAGNAAPVAANDSVVTNAGTAAFDIPEWALLANDSDAERDAIDVTSVGGAANGGVSHAPGSGTDGVVTFTAASTGSGARFTYSAADSLAASPLATVFVSSLAQTTASVFGSAGRDIVVGAQNGDALYGQGGDDILLGNGGADTLYGGVGFDHLAGGLGDDLLYDDGLGNLLDGGGGIDAWFGTLSGGGTVLPGANLVGIERLQLTLGLGRYSVTAGDEAGEGTGYAADRLSVNWSGSTAAVTQSATGTGSGSIGDGTNELGFTDVEYLQVSSGSGNDTFRIDLGFQQEIDAGAGYDTLVVDASGGAAPLYLSISPGGGSVYLSTGSTVSYVSDFDALDATGGSGNDSLQVSGALLSTLRGGNGNDTLYGGTLNDTLIGGLGDDLLYDDGLGNLLDGGGGIDAWFGTLSGGGTVLPGANLVGIERLQLTLGLGRYSVTAGDEAGEGTGYAADRLSVNWSGSTAAVTQSATGTGSGSIGDGTNELGFTDVEYLQVSSGSGNDTFRIDLGFQQEIDAGAGYDTLVVDASGGAAPLYLSISPGGGSVYLSTGSTVSYVSDFDALDATGGSGNDSLQVSGALLSTLRGGNGNDTLYGGTLNDTLIGGLGDDLLYDDGLGNLLDGGGGIDAWFGTLSGGGTVLPGANLVGIERLQLTLGLGRYSVTAGDEAGEGTGYAADRLSVNWSGSTAAVTQSATGTGSGSIGDGTNELGFTDVEYLQVSSGSGNDTFRIDLGFQQEIDAGAGYDTLVVDASGGAAPLYLSISPGGGSVYLSTGSTVSYVSDFDALDATGGSGNDSLQVSGALLSTLRGGNGNDTLYGGTLNDTLIGGLGDDLLYDDGLGNLLDGGGGIDAWFGTLSGGGTVLPGANLVGIERLQLTLGLGRYSVTAGDEAGEGTGYAADRLSVNWSGSTAAVTQSATGTGSGSIGDGTNELGFTDVEYLQVSSGSGNDTFRIDLGFQQEIDAGAGYDTLVVDASGGAAPLYLSISPGGGSVYLSTGSNVSYVSDFDALDATGGSGNDSLQVSGALLSTLRGGNGNDTLYGGTLNDTLIGGEGADLLAGGGAVDRFVFLTIRDSGTTVPTADRIADYVHGDIIDLSGIDARTQSGTGDDAFAYGGRASAGIANGVTWFEEGGSGNGRTVVQLDADGDAVADMILVLAGVGLGLQQSDFAL